MLKKIFASFLMMAFLLTASTPFYAQDKKKDTKAKTEQKEEKVADKKEMKCGTKKEDKKAEKKSCCSEAEEEGCETKDVK